MGVRVAMGLLAVALVACPLSASAFAPGAASMMRSRRTATSSFFSPSHCAYSFRTGGPRPAPAAPATGGARPGHRGGAARPSVSMELQFFQSKDLKGLNWNSPSAEGNFGKVFFATLGGQKIVIKCPVLEEFSLKIFDTERAVLPAPQCPSPRFPHRPSKSAAPAPPRTKLLTARQHHPMCRLAADPAWLTARSSQSACGWRGACAGEHQAGGSSCGGRICALAHHARRSQHSW